MNPLKTLTDLYNSKEFNTVLKCAEKVAANSTKKKKKVVTAVIETKLVILKKMKEVQIEPQDKTKTMNIIIYMYAILNLIEHLIDMSERMNSAEFLDIILTGCKKEYIDHVVESAKIARASLVTSVSLLSKQIKSMPKNSLEKLPRQRKTRPKHSWEGGN
jgi:hypothetical protein